MIVADRGKGRGCSGSLGPGVPVPAKRCVERSNAWVVWFNRRKRGGCDSWLASSEMDPMGYLASPDNVNVSLFPSAFFDAPGEEGH
jgi:hypothetical protein